MRHLTAALAVGSFLLVGCDPASLSVPDVISAEGVVSGEAFLDVDGNDRTDATTDLATGNVRVLLSPGRAGSVAYVLHTSSDGRIPPTRLPVGTYSISVDASSLADTVVVAGLDSAEVTVTPLDTAFLGIRLGFPPVSIQAARMGTSGRKVVIQGIALDPWGTFGDSSVHVLDGTGAIRVSGPPANVATGDSIRVVGRIGTKDGSPALLQSTISRIKPGIVEAVTVTTAGARGAMGGTLDASLVELIGTVTRDPVATPAGDLLFHLTDSSGTLQVVLDKDARINQVVPIRIGAQVALAGVLVRPAESPEWVLKPRATDDLEVTYALSSISDARTGPRRYLRIRGVALNAGGAFPDASLHLRGGLDAIRVYPGARTSFLPGDSVEVIGERITLADGQPAITGAGVSLLRTGPAPAPVALSSSAGAATAQGASLDAALVSLAQVTVRTIAQVPGQLQLTVDDGSGPLSVVLFNPNQSDGAGLGPGSKLDLVGLLVAINPTTWRLHLRSPGDLRPTF